MRKSVIACLVIAACAAPAAVDERDPYPAYAASSRLPLDVCRVDGVEEPLLCGDYEVFENRDAASGRRIPIRVVVIPAQEPRRTNSAWIEHEGGPRYSMVANAYRYAEGGEFEWFRRDRDVVLIDPRGLHASYPLFCDALQTPRLLERYYTPERVAECRAELETRADLAQYSTANAVDDFDEIRSWLGYDQWDAGGWSYGSRFMLTYLHRHPESFRSITLHVPATLNFDRPIDYARFGQEAFDGLAADCAVDADCAARFPDVAADLAAVLARLENAPRQVEIVNPYNGARETRTVTRDIFAESVWIALLWNQDARQLPFVLRRAAEDDFGPFVDLTVPASPPDPEPEGHYFSVVCPEETLLVDPDAAAAASRGTFVGDYIYRDYRAACEAWGLPAHPDHPVAPRVFDVPALIVTGDRDPVTAPEYGEAISQHFTNALHLVVPHMSHGVGGFENGECPGELLANFVDRASVEGLDTSCIGEMRPPPFRLE